MSMTAEQLTAFEASTALLYTRKFFMAHRSRHLGILGAVFDGAIGARLLRDNEPDSIEGGLKDQTSCSCACANEEMRADVEIGLADHAYRRTDVQRSRDCEAAGGAPGAWTGSNGWPKAPAMLNGHKLKFRPTVIDLSDQLVPDPPRTTTT